MAGLNLPATTNNENALSRHGKLYACYLVVIFIHRLKRQLGGNTMIRSPNGKQSTRPGIIFSILLLCCASSAPGEENRWITTSADDFQEGTMDATDSWSNPGNVQLARNWMTPRQVNNEAGQSRDFPRLASRLDETSHKGFFFIVWEDERDQDHYPDIHFNITKDSGIQWLNDGLISGGHVNNIRKKSPDIAVRSTDNNLWVVWQQDTWTNDGDIYYSTSGNDGLVWSTPATLYAGAGNQLTPRISGDATSSRLYSVWEDEGDDDGDIFISRYDGAWSSPIKISDDTTAKEQQTPDIAADSSGNIFAVWHDARSNDDGDIYFSRWLNGSTWSAGNWSANIRLNDTSVDWAQASPSIITGADNSLYVVWAERVPTGPATYDFQIVVARSNDSGTTWSNTVVDKLVSDGLDNYAAPAIGVDTAGRLYIAWLYNTTQHAADGVILTAVSPDRGEHWTDPHTVSGTAVDVKSTALPCLEYAADDRLLVAWDDYRDTTADIYVTGYPAVGYRTRGEYSATLNAGGSAKWKTINWTETVPANTALTISSRVKTNPSTEWSPWVTHGSSGESLIHPPAQYLQYRATLTTSDLTSTPILEEVEVSYEQTSWPMFMPGLTSFGSSR